MRHLHAERVLSWMYILESLKTLRYLQPDLDIIIHNREMNGCAIPVENTERMYGGASLSQGVGPGA